MHEQPNRTATARRRLAALVTLLGVLTLTVGVLPSAADHGFAHAVPLARGSFDDAVAAQVRVKLDNQRTHAINVKDASDVVFLEITIHDGARAPWHTHAGPGFLVNKGPGTLSSVIGDDCIIREYGPGQAFVDHGGGTPHAAFNDSGQDLVLYAVFLDVDNGPVLPADPPPNCDLFP